SPGVMTPDDIMAGKTVTGPVIVYDDDQYYMGGVIAEKLRGEGHEVTLVTPGADVSNWAFFTDEQFKAQAKLMKMGVKLVLTHRLTAWHGDHARIACNYTGDERRIEAA